MAISVPDLEDTLVYLNIFPKGYFYMKEDDLIIDDHLDRTSLVSLDSSNDRYLKFYVMDSSTDGWIYYLWNHYGEFDYWLENGDNIEIEGNITYTT